MRLAQVLLVGAISLGVDGHPCEPGMFFGVPNRYPAGAQPEIIARGDLNNDGAIDLVVGNRFSDNVTVMINDGSGLFPTRDSIGLAYGRKTLAVGDLDGNGLIDIVTSRSNTEDLSILMAGCDASLCFAEFTGDGTLDIFDVFAFLDLFNAGCLLI